MWRAATARAGAGLALAGSSLASVCLFAIEAARTHNLAFAYLNWNLFLAWLPMLFAVWLVHALGRHLWSSWRALGLTALWLGFLPNSFYMVSDFIHLHDVPRAHLLYDTVMLASFIFNGVLFGLLSLFMVHQALRLRMRPRAAAAMVGGILLVCSFAIYLGRDLRWNSWDVLTNPGGLLFDVSERLLHPAAYPQTFTTTASFFVLLASLYIVAWQLARAVRQYRGPSDII